MNQIIIQGNLGTDPEIKQVGEYELCQFSLAHTPWSKAKGEGETIWFKVTVWGNKAPAVARELRKGDSVTVTGKFGVSKYTKDGLEKTSNEIAATDVAITIKVTKASGATQSEDTPGW